MPEYSHDMGPINLRIERKNQVDGNRVGMGGGTWFSLQCPPIRLIGNLVEKKKRGTKQKDRKKERIDRPKETNLAESSLNPKKNTKKTRGGRGGRNLKKNKGLEGGENNGKGRGCLIP